MPYRYTFLAKQFDTSRSWDEFEIPSQHRNLKIEDLAVNLDWFIPKNWRKNENGELELDVGSIPEQQIQEYQDDLYDEYAEEPIFDLPEDKLLIAKNAMVNALSQKGLPGQTINDLLELDMQGALIQLTTWLSEFDDVERKNEIFNTFIQKREEIQEQFSKERLEGR